MKKYLLSLAGSVMCLLYGNAQDCTFYFPLKVGTTIELKTFDAKDKVTSSLKEVVLEQTPSTVKFNCETFDKNGKSLTKGDFEVKCKDGEFVIDMSSYTRSIDMSAYKDMDVVIETDEMSIPAKPVAGQTLKNGGVTIKVNNGGMTLMNMNVKILNRKVEGFEDVTTPAGTFKCMKISYDIETQMVFNIKAKGVEWISQTAGLVRSESYNTKGKLQGYTILTSLK